MSKPKRWVILPAVESELEATLLLQIRAAGLPIPERQLRFAAGIGRDWRWDFSWFNWTNVMLAVEVQGGIWMKKGGHNTGKGINNDCEKHNEAVLMGWTVLVVTKEQIDNRQAIIWIARALQRLGVAIETNIILEE